MRRWRWHEGPWGREDGDGIPGARALLIIGMALLFAGTLVPITAAFGGAAPHLYGTVSRNILRSGDWLTLHHARWSVFDKPPLTLWIMALSFAAFGVSEPALMAWHILCAALVVLVTYALARLALPRRQAVLAALALLASAMFFDSSLSPQQDIPLTLFISASIYWYLRWERDGRPYQAIVSAFSAALAMLTKGIVGVAFPAAVVMLRLAIDRPRMPRRALATALAAVLAFLLTAAPWFIVGYVRQGKPFVDTFFLNGHVGVGRFLYALNRTNSPLVVPPWAGFGANLTLVFYGTLPWVGWVWPAVVEGWRARGRGFAPLWVCTLWAAVVFGTLSISPGDQTLRYLLPLAPPLAVLAGRVIGDPRFDTVAVRVSLLAAALMLTIAAAVLRLPLPHVDAPYLAEHFFASYLPLAEGFALLTAAGLCGYAAAVRWGAGKSGVVALFGMILVAHAFAMAWLSLSWDRLSPWRPIARIVNRIPAPPRVLIIDSVTRGGYSDYADFYIDRPVEFVNQKRLAEAWEQGPLLAVLTDDALRALPRQPAVTILATERHGLTVVTNAPSGRGARDPGR